MPSNSKTSRAANTKPRATAKSAGLKSGPAREASRTKDQETPASSASERSARSASALAVARRSGPPPNRRQSRAWLRAEARRRRNRWIMASFTVVVVGALVGLLVTHWPLTGSSAKTASGTHCAPTPTSPVGPVPAQTPDPTPPPVSAKPVSGQQGLQYIDIAVGCGDTAQAGDTVTVKYTGWLQSDGKMFDSSLLHGGTFQIPSPLDSSQPQVIEGWNIGLDGMKIGGTRRLIIPPALGYGAAGSPPTIPPNATLIFDITLVSIDATG